MLPSQPPILSWLVVFALDEPKGRRAEACIEFAERVGEETELFLLPCTGRYVDFVKQGFSYDVMRMEDA